MDRLLPINILLITYERINFLKKTIDAICDRTMYPYRLTVVDNASTDGTVEYLKNMKVIGKVFDVLYLPENVGQPKALNAGFDFMQSWEDRRPSDDFFITTQDDCIPPLLRPCWLERLVHIMEKHEPDYGSVCMRIERTSRLEWDEWDDDIIENHKTMPSVFRIARRSAIASTGERPFGRLLHWESHTFADTMKFKLKKKFGMATHLYASHIGYMADNKGYVDGFTNYKTYSKERVHQGIDKPYPTIDYETNIPLSINHPYDSAEHMKRMEYWGVSTGKQSNAQVNIKRPERELLATYLVEGKVADLGCGLEKIHSKCIGIDTYPFDCVDIVHRCDDLWFFKDNELDGIMASHVLEHIADTKKVLKEWDRTIRRGGRIAIIVPDGETYAKTILEESHKVAFTKPILKHLFCRFLGYKLLVIDNVPETISRRRPIILVAEKCI